jgi:hypothetical protein
MPNGLVPLVIDTRQHFPNRVLDAAAVGLTSVFGSLNVIPQLAPRM